MAKPPTILFLIVEDHYVLSHRKEMILTLIRAGFQVIVATKLTDQEAELKALDVKIHSLTSLDRTSLNPFSGWQTLREIIRIYKTYQPDIAHHVGLKMILLGLISAIFTRVKNTINVFAGLGYLFTSSKPVIILIRTCIMMVLKACFRCGNHHVVVQNKDDAATLRSLVPQARLHLILGVGVNLEDFEAKTSYEEKEEVKLICVCRMLLSKGIGELIEAARFLRQKGLLFRLLLVGGLDEANPDKISLPTLQEWQAAGLADYMGKREDIAELYENADIAVLPSYREGLPKSLLEAAACGLPIVTTAVPGCREVVENGINGFMVPLKDIPALANALEKLISTPALRQLMGEQSRKRAETLFSSAIINQQMIDLHRQLSQK